MYPSDDLNLFATVTVSLTARRKFCSDTHVWVAFYLYMQEYLRKKNISGSSSFTYNHY